MDNKTIAAELIDIMRNNNLEPKSREAIYLAVDMLSNASNGLVMFEGKLYSAAKPLLKTQHTKTGECSFGGFYERKM